MSSSWTERQGYIGDLQTKSRDELCEILLRQEKLLSNRRFIQTLPDKGRKISEFAQRLRLALAHCEEEEKRRDMLSSVRTEFQSKYQQALSLRQPGNPTDAVLPEAAQKAPTHKLVNQLDFLWKDPPADKNVSADELNAPAGVSMKTVSDGGAGFSVSIDCTQEKDLVDALENVTLSEDTVATTRFSATQFRDCAGVNPFHSKQQQKKMHCLDVLEKTEKNTATRKPKFKLNQLPQRSDGSLTGALPSESLGMAPQLSADARRERDRKHLDDITAAKLPPLHHSPAQLLSLEESVTLQQEHNRKHKKLQAKMAAQKLSGQLGVNMTSYCLEVGQDFGYRESQADKLSSDED